MSATKTIEILIPCEEFQVEVQLGPENGLSPLELIALRALKRGIDRFEDLAHLFQLGHRPTLDLVSDLWRGGYIFVDFGEGRIRALDHVLRRLDTEKEIELAGGERFQRPASLMQELISGSILPLLPLPRRWSSERVAPQILPPGSFKDAVRADRTLLLRALERIVASWTDSARSLKVLGANLRMNEVLNGELVGRRRLFELQLQGEISPSGRLDLKVLKPTSLPGKVRREFEIRLGDLAGERPDDPFFKFLRESFRSDSDSGIRLSDNPMARLRKKVENFDRLPATVLNNPRVVGNHQDDFADLATIILEGVSQRQAERVRVKVLSGREAIDDAIRSAIGEAQKQIVLGCPAVRWEGFSRYLRGIEKAIERRVRIFMLWGLRPDDPLDTTVRNAFDDLERRGGFFCWARYSSRSNARFCLRDGELAIFTNVSFLDGGDGAKPSLGVCVRAAEGADLCRPVIDQLDRVYRNFPDHRLAARLLIHPPTRRKEESDALPPATLPAIPVAPEISQLASDYGEALLIAWRSSWHEFVTSITAQLEDQGTTASLVHDSQHRDLLLQALRESRQWVVVADERLSSAAIDLKLSQALRDCLEQGTVVVLIHSYLPTQDKAVKTRIVQLQQSFPQLFKSLTAPCQGGLLITDDWLLTTSFDFLSLAGFTEAPDRRRVQLETGLLVRSREAAHAALSHVAATVPDLGQLLGKSRQDSFVAADPGPTGAEVARQRGMAERHKELLDRLAPPRKIWQAPHQPVDRAAELKRWFLASASLSSTAADLEVLIAALPVADRRLAVAAGLAHGGMARPKRDRWLSWLAEDRWHSDSWNEAAVLIEGLETPGGGGTLPPLALAHLAASTGNRQWRESLIESLLDAEIDLEGKAAAVCLVCPALLLDGITPAWYLLEAWQNDLPAPLAAWSSAIQAYWTDVGTPIPVDALARQETIQQAVRLATDAREALLAAFENAATIGFSFPLGVKTWARLFHPNGPLGSLRPLIVAAEVGKVQAWLDRRAVDGELEELMDRTARQVSVDDPSLRMDRIVDPKRTSCLQRLDAFQQAARLWVDSEKAASNPSAHLTLIEKSRELGLALRSTQDGVEQLARFWTEKRSYSAPLARRLLTELSILLRV